MSAILINRNPDLAKLQAEGFRLRIVQKTASHLLIEGIPAVNAKREVVAGSLYCPLIVDAAGNTENPCSNHQCWWIGEAPCDADGRVMTEMISGSSAEDKGDGIKTNLAFSRKHVGQRPYADYHEKIWTYVRMIWQEAQALDPTCDPRGDRPIPAVLEAQARAFRYPDMATTRAGIGAATAKLLARRVGIIGLGGTGSYILDLLAKTPIEEIHLFDGDVLQLHNAFRTPGAPGEGDFTERKKVDWFASIYGRMHRGIRPHPYHVTAETLNEFAGFDFAFVAIDDGDARNVILPGLLGMGVPLIDVGMDLDLDGAGSLRGMIRVTLATPDFHEHLEEVISLATAPGNDVYRNIQVADLNMLNASMAVTRWKRLRGFYGDEVREHHSNYSVTKHALTKEDRR